MVSTPSTRDLSQVIYSFLGTNPKRLTFFCSAAVAIEGLVVGTIITQTTRYLDNFWRTDHPLALSAIVFGCTLCLAQMGVNMWQTYRLIDKAATSLTTIVVDDVKANMGVLLLIGIFNFAAAGFFARRAWNLAGRKLWLFVPLVLSIFTSLGLSLGVATKGFQLPALSENPDYHDLVAYQSWLEVDNRLIKIWTALSLGKDIFVCGLMTIMLLKSRHELHRTEKTLLRVLLKLTYETMAGPVIVNTVNLAVIMMQGATFADYSRMVTWIVGPIYFSSILQSLNYRKDVQAILRLEPSPRRTRQRQSRQSVDRWGSGSIPLTSTDLGSKEVGMGSVESGSGTAVENGSEGHAPSPTSRVGSGTMSLGETSRALLAMEERKFDIKGDTLSDAEAGTGEGPESSAHSVVLQSIKERREAM